MLLSLALRYQKHIALFLLSISFVQLTIAERIAFYRSDVWANAKSRKAYSKLRDISNTCFFQTKQSAIF